MQDTAAKQPLDSRASSGVSHLPEEAEIVASPRVDQSANIDDVVDWRKRYEEALEHKVSAEQRLIELHRELRVKQIELDAADKTNAVIVSMEEEIEQVIQPFLHEVK